ncbi:MAG: DUF5985 family protein [Gemmatimonadaceae bacterium]
MTTTQTTVVFLSGVLCAGYAVAALFFLRFWNESRDRLFLFFSAAFAVLMLQRAGLAIFGGSETETIWYYLVRLAAFVLILIAIVDKNRGHRR